MIALRDFTGMLLAKEMRVATIFLTLTTLSTIGLITSLIIMNTDPTFVHQSFLMSVGFGILAVLSVMAFGTATDYICDRG